MNVQQAINIGDLRRIAKRRLRRIIFDYIEGGVEDEDCLRRNEAAFCHYRMVPRYLVDVSGRDQSIMLFGAKYASPFGISPTGLNGLFRRNADLILAETAAAARIPYIMSSVANSSLEQVVKIAPQMWFQVYGVNDRVVVEDIPRCGRRYGAARERRWNLPLGGDGRRAAHAQARAEHAQWLFAPRDDHSVDHRG